MTLIPLLGIFPFFTRNRKVIFPFSAKKSEATEYSMLYHVTYMIRQRIENLVELGSEWHHEVTQ